MSKWLQRLGKGVAVVGLFLTVGSSFAPQALASGPVLSGLVLSGLATHFETSDFSSEASDQMSEGRETLSMDSFSFPFPPGDKEAEESDLSSFGEEVEGEYLSINLLLMPFYGPDVRSLIRSGRYILRREPIHRPPCT